MCVRQWQVHPAACFGQIPATGLIAVSGALQYRGTKFCSWLLHIHGVTIGAHNHQFNMSWPIKIRRKGWVQKEKKKEDKKVRSSKQEPWQRTKRAEGEEDKTGGREKNDQD